MTKIRCLPPEVVRAIAAGETIDSLAAVVRELAENAIDAQATRITIALWSNRWDVRVTDNGVGMDRAALQQAARPHTTSKIQSWADLTQIQSLGFRGEALYSLACLARLTIRSLPRANDPLSPIFSNSSSTSTAATASIAPTHSAPISEALPPAPAPTSHLKSSPVTGYQAMYNAEGKVIDWQATALSPGTIVTVEDLFHELPGRREALPRVERQRVEIRQTIDKMALCHPHITWQIWWNDRLAWRIEAATTAKEILPQVNSSLRVDDLSYTREVLVSVPIESLVRESSESGESSEPVSPGVNELFVGESSESSAVSEPVKPIEPTPDPRTEVTTVTPWAELVLGLPDRCHRRRPDWIYIAVNGRIVNQAELTQALLRATARTLPRQRYPVAFLHLHLDPCQVDWNRTPAKNELYLRELDQLAQVVDRLVTQAAQLSAAEQPQRVKALLVAAEMQGAYRLDRQLEAAATPAITPDQLDSNPASPTLNPTIDPIGNPTLTPKLALTENAATYEVTTDATGTNSAIASAQATQAIQATQKSLPHHLRAIAQASQMYIVAESDQGIWLVEQHIAHERVLYEQLQQHWQLVDLELPLILTHLHPNQVERLTEVGISIEPFGEAAWAVRNAPAPLVDRDDLREAIVELSHGDLQAAQVATACRSAIRNGTPLTIEQMQTLLDRWQQTRQPHTCPHGRPIYLSLSESSLSRFFRRHWVIGKSHGI